MLKKYPSKVSYWLLTFIFLCLFGPTIFKVMEDGLTRDLVKTQLFLVVIFGLILHIFFGTAYTVTDTHLKIKCGFIKYKSIPILDIKKISVSKSILSSPAPSFDRIAISYGKNGEIIISPKDKFEFAKYLTAINSNIINTLSEN